MSAKLDLPDLSQVIEDCKSQVAAVDPNVEVKLSPGNAEKLLAAYKELNPKHTIVLVGGHSFAIGTGEQA